MKIYLDMVGCRLNQSEIETYARQFRKVGHSLVASPGDADMVVINTCAVTAQAASDSRQKIRQAARAGSREIVVTGCWSTLNPAEAQSLPNVTHVIANDQKDRLVQAALLLPEDDFDEEPLARKPLPGLRQRTRAFIKVQDGCNNRCTFCITTLARGASRSRSAASVVKDIQAAIDGGSKEAVLTGVHLGSWGQDIAPDLRLENLIEAILRETNIPRIRLSSLEPWDIRPAFFSLWENPRMCPHLHLPLQSGSGKILRRMARRVTPSSFAALVDHARRIIPEIAITTDIIVGFPGEGPAEFSESLGYVREIGFAGGHVFAYSPRPGTAAESFPGQVPQIIKKQRSAVMRSALANSSLEYARQYFNKTVQVLWESADGLGPQGWQLHGLSENDLRITSNSPELLWNEISTVKLNSYDGETLSGEITP